MNFYAPRKAQQTTQREARRFSHRLQVERLEDRVVPSIADGTLLVATGPSTFSYEDQSSFPTGIIGVNPSTTAQTAVSTGGLFSLPTYFAEAPNGQLYITDLTSSGTGAIIALDPNTAQQRLVAKGGYIDGPNVLVYMNGFLYVADEGDASSTVHNLVQVDPSTGNQRLITDGSSGSGFDVPTGMVPAPGHNVYVTDEPGNFAGSDPGSVWEINLDTGQQTLISHGGLFDHPVDLALESSGNLLVVNTGNAVDNFSGSVIRVDPQTGTQTLVSSFSPDTGLDSIEVAPDGTIDVGAISAGNTPGIIYAVDPVTGAQRLIAAGGGLSQVEGIRVFHATTVQPGATATTLASSAASSAFGQMVTFTATVLIQGSSTLTPTGMVQFQIDGSNVGNPVGVTTPGGVTTASLSTASLSVGTHTITAIYSGDGNFLASTGTLTSGQTVNKAGTSLALASSTSPSAVGQSVTFTATISITAPGAGTPAGTVQFQIDGSNVGSPVSVSTAGGATTASFSTSTLTAGSHTVTASYSGDSNFTSSTGTLSGGQLVTSGPGGNVVATLDPSTGLLSITGDAGTDNITITQTSSGAIQITGSGTTINQSANPALFSSITGITVSFQGGDDSLTMTQLSLPGSLSITAGSGSDSIALNGINVSVLSISTAGPGKDAISLSGTSAWAANISAGDNATLSLYGVTSSSMTLAAGNNATVSVNGTSASSGLSITLGDNARSVTVLASNLQSLNIVQTGVTGTPLFDLEHDSIGTNLNLSAGGGNNTVRLAYVDVAIQLLVYLGSGKNTVSATNVTASFGVIDGGPGGNNTYLDGGGNSGFQVYHFRGH